MRIGSTKFRQSLLLFLCFIGLSLLVTACGSSSDCGSGYEEIDGECVPITTG
jgi:hypothetical protein